MPATTEYFRKDKSKKDGLRPSCKYHDKQYHKKNKEHILEKAKQYYEENKDKHKEYYKNYNEVNRERGLERQKQYYEENKDIFKQYYEENKERLNNQSNIYRKKRKKTDIGFRILSNCRSRVNKALKCNIKSASTKKLIGCSIEKLLEHLESQFQDGMTWDNYGEWHVDHIKPCALFDFTKEEEQRECFHYTNLQPLWAEDNLRKSDKYIEEDEQLSIAI